jgi:hypothetical protein
MSDKSSSNSADSGADEHLDRDLRALFRRVQEEPVSEELKRLARMLEQRLQHRDED